jgi:hypothetical protein
MRKNIIAVIFLLLLTCCKNYNNDLDKNLYDAILKYQEDYPIPKLSHSEEGQTIYLYKVYFFKEKKDTIIVLQRSPAGLSKLDKGYGIYQDDSLNPTFIYDDNNLGTKFIKNKINDTEKNKKFYWLIGATPSERFPPVYKYKIQNKELKLVKIDTIWKTWD